MKLPRKTWFLKDSLYCLSTCRPYREVLPNGFCKDAIRNQFISQDNDRAIKVDFQLRQSREVLMSFIKREAIAKRDLMKYLDTFIIRKFVFST